MTKVKLRQIFYDKKQGPLLDTSCEHFFNRHTSPAEFEFGIMKWFYEKGELFNGDFTHTGFVSWKFHEKARIKAGRFIKFAESNPGYDIYIINPFPEQVVHKNTWHQAELRHPGLACITKRLFELAGLNWDPLTTPNIAGKLSYCNFWVGSEAFWKIYMDYALKFYQIIQDTPELKTRFYAVAPGATSAGANYFTFFFERILTEILTHHPEIKVKTFRYSASDLHAVFKPKFADFLLNLPFDEDLSDLLTRLDWREIADFRYDLVFRQFDLENFNIYRLASYLTEPFSKIRLLLKHSVVMEFKRSVLRKKSLRQTGALLELNDRKKTGT